MINRIPHEKQDAREITNILLILFHLVNLYLSTAPEQLPSAQWTTCNTPAAN